MRQVASVILAALVLLSSSIAIGLPLTNKKVTPQIDFDAALIGGRPAKDGELPFSVFIQNCTASLVGPETALTAGHCRETGEKITFVIGNTRFIGDCVQHPQFDDVDVDNDFTLCKFAPRINNLAILASLEATNIKTGDSVTLQGFGRNSLGTKKVGTAKVVEIDGQDLITNSSVKLGGGDSGGGLLGGTPDLVNGPFVIVGINSRASINGNFSFFNRVNLKRSQDFFKKFAQEKSVEICGINSNCVVNKCEDEKENVRSLQILLNNAKEDLKECLEN